MSYGKYSPNMPHDQKEFVHHEWKTGTLGYPVSVDVNGYDWYGYDEDGRDRLGMTEEDHLREWTEEQRLEARMLGEDL